MRLWHQELLPYLPTMQLCGQHRECCALRGNGWGMHHSTVNYVWNYQFEYLYHYHQKVIKQLESRITKKGKKYQIDPKWKNRDYRGKHRPPLPKWGFAKTTVFIKSKKGYPEHNETYLNECISNLYNKIKQAPPGKYPQKEIDNFLQYIKSKNIVVQTK